MMKKSLFLVMAAMAMMSMSTAAYAAESAHFVKDGNVSDALVGAANAQLSLMPEAVLERLAADGWTFRLTDQNLSQVFYDGAYSSIAGVTDAGSASIYIEDRESAIHRAVIHETGHAVDFALRDKGMTFYSQSAEFTSAFETEKYSFPDSTAVGDGHETSNAQEYFASAWSEYYVNPDNLRARAPQTYACIEACLERYTECVETVVPAGVLTVAACTDKVLSGPGAVDAMKVDTETQEALRSALGESVSDGNGHELSAVSGEIYYLADGETIYSNGLADDGYIYTDGKQENTLTYYAEKYNADYQNASESDYLTYDSETEFRFFLGYLQCTEGTRQGIDYNYWNVAGATSKIRVQKSEIQRVIGSPSADYESSIQELAARIPLGLTIKETVFQTDVLAAELLQYDPDYLTTDIETALSDGRGVCYHYAKLEHDILAVLGISSEYVQGSYTGRNGGHLWLRVWDDENSHWLYKDPTAERKYVVDSRMYWDISYASYATHYTPAPAVGTSF